MSFVITYLALLVFVSDLLLVLLIFFWKKVAKKIAPYALDWALLVAILSTVGSLFLSEVALIPPCKLCWYQRIFMYPLVVILITAKVRKIPKVWEIVLPLSIIGTIIAAYHYIIQLFPKIATTCGFSIPCTDTTIKEFGFVTIPWMSLTAFVWMIVFMLILRSYKLKKN